MVMSCFHVCVHYSYINFQSCLAPYKTPGTLVIDLFSHTKYHASHVKLFYNYFIPAGYNLCHTDCRDNTFINIKLSPVEPVVTITSP